MPNIAQRLRQKLATLLSLGDAELNQRAMSAARLFDKVWALLTWDEYLADLIYEGDQFTALVYDYDANMYAIPIVFNGDDVSFGEWVRVAESYEVVPVDESSEGETQRATKRATKRATPKTVLRAFEAGGEKYVLMHACTSVINRVAEIDSSQLFDTFVARFAQEDYPTPYFTVRHNGTALSMGDAVFVGRDGVVLVTLVKMRGTEFADLVFESIQAKPDYWGISIGYGLEETDAAPEILNLRFRSQDGDDLMFPVPVYNQGTLVEVSLLAETDAAAHFTSVNHLEVQRTMPKSRRERSLRDDLLAIFEDDDTVTAVIDDVVNGSQSINDVVAERGLVSRSATDAQDAEDATDGQDDENDTDQEDVTFELDDFAMTGIANTLAQNEQFVTAIATAMGVPASVIDGGNVADDDGSLRSMVAQIRVALHDVQEQLDDMQGDAQERSNNRQSRHVRLTTQQDAGQGSNRPRDLHRRKQEQEQEQEQDFDPKEFEDYIGELVEDL